MWLQNAHDLRKVPLRCWASEPTGCGSQIQVADSQVATQPPWESSVCNMLRSSLVSRRSRWCRNWTFAKWWRIRERRLPGFILAGCMMSPTRPQGTAWNFIPNEAVISPHQPWMCACDTPWCGMAKRTSSCREICGLNACFDLQNTLVSSAAEKRSSAVYLKILVFASCFGWFQSGFKLLFTPLNFKVDPKQGRRWRGNGAGPFAGTDENARQNDIYRYDVRNKCSMCKEDQRGFCFKNEMSWINRPMNGRWKASDSIKNGTSHDQDFLHV